MSLPWNRGDPEGSSDSWLDLLPIVHRVGHTDSERVPERSEPSMVAAPTESGDGDSRSTALDGRPMGRTRGTGPDPADDPGRGSAEPGGPEPSERGDRESEDREVTARP